MKGFIITLVVLAIGGASAFAIEPFLPITWQEKIAGYQLDLNDEWSPAVPVGTGPGGTESKPPGFDGPVAAAWGLIDKDTGLNVQTRLDPVTIRTGSGNADFSVNINRGPFIVWFRTRSTSSLANDFELFIKGGSQEAAAGTIFALGPDGSTELGFFADQSGRNYYVINESGRFELKVRSAGLDWEVRVGVEP